MGIESGGFVNVKYRFTNGTRVFSEAILPMPFSQPVLCISI